MSLICTQCGSGSVMITGVADTGRVKQVVCGNCGFMWDLVFQSPSRSSMTLRERRRRIKAIRAHAANHPHGTTAALWHLGIKDER